MGNDEVTSEVIKTVREIRNHQVEQNGIIAEQKVAIVEMNGRLDTIGVKLDGVISTAEECGELKHETRISLLEATSRRHTINWGHVLNLLLAAVQAILLFRLSDLLHKP